MAHVSAYNTGTGSSSLYLGIHETYVTDLSAHRTEETGIALAALRGEIIDYMTLAVQRYPVLIAVAGGIQLLPGIACHIYVVIHLEVYHLSLHRHIAHIIQLLGTRDNVWVILCSVALLISIGHIMGYGLHTLQQVLHLFCTV